MEFHTGVYVLLEPSWNLNAVVISFNILQKLIVLVTIGGQKKVWPPVKSREPHIYNKVGLNERTGAIIGQTTKQKG